MTTSTAAANRTVVLPSAAQTRAAGAALGEGLLQLKSKQPLVVTLNGELGAGKTTFVGGLMAALGYAAAVRSPTYTLIEPYELADLNLFHLDLYRLTDPSQLDELGVRDLLQPGAILLIEWAERAGNVFALPDLAINLSYRSHDTDGRLLTLIPHSAAAKQLSDNVYFSVADQ